MSPKKKPGMLKRGVQPTTIDNVAAKVQAAESAITQQFETKNVSLSNINLWEDQPRAFKLTIEDVIRGFILEDDEHYGDKSDELNNIISLALSIKELGLLYTPLGFALPGKCVQLLGGQRRTMASIFALFHISSSANDDGHLTHEVKVSPAPDLTLMDNERVAIKVFSRKPDELTLERMAVADNTQRSDLSIGDRLRWAMKFADMLHDRKHELTWRDLADTLALNRSQAFEWKKVIDNRHDQYIKKTIDLVIQESISFKQLTELSAEAVKNRKIMFDSWFKKKTNSGSIKKVSLGSTSNYSALKSLIMANVHGEQTQVFEKVDWEKPQQVKKAFNAFLTYWESNNG